ncbi:MAG: hypothetical protein A4E49_02141 [Methanosaeta sp. PtaU1.Bin112]|nr:MAG: hypothetical protein A4E49_02141 [Methanosaeta sp. PtaU1.Bin112]
MSFYHAPCLFTIELSPLLSFGMLTAEQVKRVVEVSARYSSEIHLTVRQGMRMMKFINSSGFEVFQKRVLG